MKLLTLVATALLSAAPALAAPLSVALSSTDPALKCGAKTTPTLTFSGTPPSGTKRYAAIFWDQMPRALSGRWLVFDLPLSTKSLTPMPAAQLNVAGGKAATNEAGQAGYSAICSRGQHDIYIDFYAIDTASLNLPAGAPLQQVHAAIKRHKLLETKAHLSWPLK
ncbi:hypothetical protein GCM10022631_25170 [Deinococcus rubellus]|uniref:YbhB/YbcL family Raf kinase inhibitor-like protein n=1 Tax=Deinococcus rubellus TaxID=1889240 RepID=A0ABY5YGK6_9DEIO|nr:hypothetical protein [Deinococcus rubellus]UWX63943.1 hypothetical protein N0D28_14660 [Deinococcus rubellus]